MNVSSFVRSLRSWRSLSQLIVSLLVLLLPKCGLCVAAYLNLFGLLGLSVVHHYAWVQPILFILLAVGMSVALVKARRMGDYRTFSVSVLGTLVLVFSKSLIVSQWGAYIGFALLAGATAWQLLTTNRLCDRTLFTATKRTSSHFNRI